MFVCLFVVLRASIDCVKLINEEHMISGSQDGYVPPTHALLSLIPPNSPFSCIQDYHSKANHKNLIIPQKSNFV